MDPDFAQPAPARSLLPSQQAIIARNNVHVRGSGARALVFAHGFGCDQNMWRFIAPAFESTHRVVLFDYVGAGKSDASAFSPSRYQSLDGYAQDLLDVCGALELRGATFVGHSVSGMIGVLASIRQPTVFSRMVLISPSPRYLNDAPDYVGGFEREDLDGLLEMMDHNYIGWASYLAPVVMGNAGHPGLAGELEASFCSTDPAAARAFATATFYADNRGDLTRVGVPALIVQVSDDAIAPVGVGHYMAEQMPNSRLTVLDATGHCPHMSHPLQTIEAIRPFIEAR